MKIQTKHSGFTLIELIVVIVVLGILASVAIPRFVDQTRSARIAALEGLRGALLSATALAQAQYRAEGKGPSSTSTTTTMDNQAVTVVAGTGRPVSTAAGIGTALQNISGYVATYSGNNATYNFSTAVTNCTAVYEQTTGNVTVTNTGC